MILSSETQKQPNTPSRQVFFYAGNTMGEFSNKPIADELKKHYPDSQIRTYTSVTTPEGQQPDHFNEMINDLESVIQSKSEATIIVYSMGAVEFTEAFFQLLERRRLMHQKDHSTFESIDLTKFHLVIRSPAGMIRGWKDRFRQCAQFVDLIGSMMTGPLPILETLLSFPVRDKDQQSHQKLILTAFKAAYSSLHENDSLQPMRIDPSDEQFLHLLRSDTNIKIQEELSLLDERLLKAAENVSQDPQSFKNIAAKRAKLLQHSGLAGKALNGELQAENDKWHPEKVPMTAVGLLGLFRTLKRAFTGNDNQELLRWFSQKGMDIKVMSEEYGVFFTLDDIEEFFTVEKTNKTKIHVNQILELGGHTHVTVTNQPIPFVEALRNSENQTRH